jgi:hypothetical protein
MRFDVPQEPHVVLFVRDALGLGGRVDVPNDPPRLAGHVPDLSSLVSSDERQRVVRGYRSSWQLALAIGVPGQEVSSELVSGAVTPDPVRDQVTRFHDSFRPPKELRRQAAAWFDEHGQGHEFPFPARESRAAWETEWMMTRDAAQAAAGQLGVDPGELCANALLLVVDGVWWATPGPGRLLFSAAVRDDAELLSRLLRETFLSSINR